MGVGLGRETGAVEADFAWDRAIVSCLANKSVKRGLWASKRIVKKYKYIFRTAMYIGMEKLYNSESSLRMIQADYADASGVSYFPACDGCGTFSGVSSFPLGWPADGCGKSGTSGWPDSA